MITSLSNEKVKLARSLARRRVRWRERSFILEGVRLLGDALQRNIAPKFVLHTEAVLANSDFAPLTERLTQRQVPRYAVSDEVMKACTDTITPPGLLAVMPFLDVAAPSRSTWTLVADGVRTPGNLGAILRAAAAAGVDQALLAPRTVDQYNPKVVRGGAGAHFCLSIQPHSWPEIETRLEGLDVWLAASRGDLPYTDVNWTRPLALIVGSEAHGASRMALALASGHVNIVMSRGIESLNVAVAAGVLLFEIARQRQATGRTIS
jgi:TrmH family RNA methyltransferase